MAASLTKLRDEVQRCRACELYKGATQAVLGEGPVRAKAMLVGEQPGDREDLEGHPFVGPAGALLDHALGDAGISRWSSRTCSSASVPSPRRACSAARCA